MANHKSAIKRHKQSLVRKDRNQSAKSKMRSAIKKVKVLIAEGKKDDAKKAFAEAQKIVSSTADKKVIHKSTGARYISRLATLLSK